MYYFLKKENFNLDIYDFDIDISPRFTKKEQELLRFFLDNFHREKEYIEIAYENFKFNLDDLKKLSYSISKKTVSIYIFKEQKEISSFYFNIFDIIAFEEEKVIYKFSRELILAHEFGNIYSRLTLLPILNLRNPYSYKFIKIFLRNFHPEKEIIVEYDINKIREMLEIPPIKYTRFYDFETKILKPILKELEESNIYIYFDKIKSNKGKGSKIKGIRLHMVNPFYIEINRDTNILLKEYAAKVEDFAIAYKNIYSYRKTHSFSETKDYIEENIDNVFKNQL